VKTKFWWTREKSAEPIAKSDESFRGQSPNNAAGRFRPKMYLDARITFRVSKDGRGQKSYRFTRGRRRREKFRGNIEWRLWRT